MTNQPLIPFNAYFQFCFDDSINTIFSEHLDTYLQRVSSDGLNVTTTDFLKRYLTGSNLPIFRNDCKIDFKLHTCKDISPESFSVSNLRQIVEFKINSDTVTIIQISDNSITFRASDKEIKTVILTKDIKLYSV